MIDINKLRYDLIYLFTEIFREPGEPDYTHIRSILQEEFLPYDTVIQSGKIVYSSGSSEFFELIILNSPNVKKKINLEDIIAIIEFKFQFDDSLATILNKISSIKNQFRPDFKILHKRNKKNDLIRDSTRFDIESHPIPYVLIYIKNYRNIWEENTEIFETPLKPDFFTTELKNFKFEFLPDEIVLERQNAWFLNPLLLKKKLNGNEIGWSIHSSLGVKHPCLLCRKRIDRIHFFYNHLCLSCADKNYLKRIQTADLEGRIALLSGARVKIGYGVGLRLLRAGASLIALTRFPHDAALRYSREPDFPKWKDKLHIYGLDFRHLTSVTKFIDFLYENYKHLDILINNAAQTVRHPPIYYRHLMENERKNVNQLPENVHSLLDLKEQFQKIENPLLESKNSDELIDMIEGNFQRSAELSQIPVAKEEVHEYGELFPEDRLDQYGEQVDLRDFNSWVTQIEDVSIPEILEVQLINQIVPTMLVSKLKPLIMQSPNKYKFIVNVSSPEGQFSFDKEGRHPHTCMAKAALNMLTYSIAEKYAYDKIFVTSVDPGWITEQFPTVAKNAKNRQFALDLEDAAARVCDPIFMGVNENKYWRGKFFRNYNSTTW